jgi:hypothetical protein
MGFWVTPTIVLATYISWTSQEGAALYLMNRSGEAFSMIGEAMKADHWRRGLADRQKPFRAVLGPDQDHGRKGFWRPRAPSFRAFVKASRQESKRSSGWAKSTPRDLPTSGKPNMTASQYAGIASAILGAPRKIRPSNRRANQIQNS